MNKAELEVSDLGLAATLVCQKVKLLGTRQDDDGRVNFVFMHTKFADEKVRNYWNDAAVVLAREYFDTIKMLKNRIYAEK